MTDKTPRRKNGLLLIPALCAAIIGLGLHFAQANRINANAAEIAATAQPAAPDFGGSFALTNQDGKLVTEKTYNKLMLVTFGFTYCPDVCPTRLQDISLTLDALGDSKTAVQPLFITIDPARDSVAQLKNYVTLYQGDIQGLTGSPEQIAAVARTFKVYYKRGEDVGDGNYMMDHSSGIYLLDKTGKVLEMFGDGTAPADMAAAIKKRLPS